MKVAMVFKPWTTECKRIGVAERRLTSFALFGNGCHDVQPSLRDGARLSSVDRGLKHPGYHQTSLRDAAGRNLAAQTKKKHPGYHQTASKRQPAL